MHKLTICTSTAGHVCKKFNADGSTVGGGNFISGTYKVLELSGLDELAQVITQSKATQLFVLGEPANGLTTGKVGLVSNSDGKRQIALCNNHFKPAEHGFFLVDVDDVDVTPDAVIKHLEAFSDAFKGVQWLRVNSSSALLKDATGWEVVRKNKYHLYACASGLQHVDGLMAEYKAYCESQGLVKYVHNKAGRRLTRYPLDVSVYSSYKSRKVFEGVGLPVNHVTDKEPAFYNVGGRVLDLSGFIAPAQPKKTVQTQHTEKQRKNNAGARTSRVGTGKLYSHSRVGLLFNRRITTLASLTTCLNSLGYKAGANGRFISPEQTTTTGNTQLLSSKAGEFLLFCHSDTSPFCGRAYSPFDAFVQYAHNGCLASAEKAVLDSTDDIAHHYEGDVPTTHVPDFNSVVDALKQGVSCYLCAHLGDGKTQTVLNTFRDSGKRILYINHSRALTANIAEQAALKGFTVATYNDSVSVIGQSNFFITTINSLNKFSIGGFDVVVVDEVLAVTETLVSLHSTLKEKEQIKALECLIEGCERKQVLLLDGDKTPYTHALMQALSIKTVFKVAPQHTQPSIVVLNNRTHKKQSKSAALVAASKVESGVFFSDSKKQATMLGVMESWKDAIVITGDNSGEKSAQAFLQNVEQHAANTNLVAYTSCMGCGVSIVNTMRELFGHYSGTVTPQAFYQMTRRYRRPVGAIKISIHNRRAFDDGVTVAEYKQVLQKRFELVDDYSGLYDVYTTIRSNFLYCKQIFDLAPDVSLLAYFKAVGLNVTTEQTILSDADCDALDDAKNTVEINMVADVMAQDCLSDSELKALDKQTGLTQQQTAAKHKTNICTVLGVDPLELDKHTVERALFDNLVGKVVAARGLVGVDDENNTIKGSFLKALLNCVDGSRVTGKQLNHKVKQALNGMGRNEQILLFKLEFKMSLPDVENDSRFSQWVVGLLKHFGLVKKDVKKTRGTFSFVLAFDDDVGKWCRGARV